MEIKQLPKKIKIVIKYAKELEYVVVIYPHLLKDITKERKIISNILKEAIENKTIQELIDYLLKLNPNEFNVKDESNKASYLQIIYLIW